MHQCRGRARISAALKMTLTCFVENSLIDITCSLKMSHASLFTNKWCTIIVHHCHYCLIVVEGVVIFLTVIYNWCRPAETTTQPLRVLGMARTEPGPASPHACLRCVHAALNMTLPGLVFRAGSCATGWDCFYFIRVNCKVCVQCICSLAFSAATSALMACCTFSSCQGSKLACPATVSHGVLNKQ